MSTISTVTSNFKIQLCKLQDNKIHFFDYPQTQSKEICFSISIHITVRGRPLNRTAFSICINCIINTDGWVGYKKWIRKIKIQKKICIPRK